MTKIDLNLYRVESTAFGAVGTLSIYNKMFCSTLEPDARDPDKNQIPEGIYYCKRRNIAPDIDVKYHNTFEIIVPGHTDVLFHPGNKEADTDMCIILGVNYPWMPYVNGERWLHKSKDTFDAFMIKLLDRSWFYMEIKNLF